MLGSSLSLTAIVARPLDAPPGTCVLIWRAAGGASAQLLWTVGNGQSQPMIWSMRT